MYERDSPIEGAGAAGQTSREIRTSCYICGRSMYVMPAGILATCQRCADPEAVELREAANDAWARRHPESVVAEPRRGRYLLPCDAKVQ